MTQLSARTGIIDTYPLPSNATAKAALPSTPIETYWKGARYF